MDELLEMIFEDENGNEVVYCFLDTIRYNKKDYDIFQEKGTDHIEILAVGKETDEAVEYEDVDEALYDKLYKMYKGE